MLNPTIGLEIHLELKTKNKMFCACLNDPKEKRANINVCPICLGHPGSLPTINKEAVKSVLKLGLALNAEISNISQFERKSYFYPDLPKGYQISQYEKPLCQKGFLEIFPYQKEPKKIRLRRIHLEEDTARLIHQKNKSLLDFNRAGVPLLELVTEPDIQSSKEAVAFAKELQLLCRYLEISDADLEKGEMRIEPNISLNLGTKVELKNLNSFRALEEGIEYEINRQKKALEKGEKIRQETRGWDEQKKITVIQRFKEEAEDYRYFPEPDLPPLNIPLAFDLYKLASELEELPAAKRQRFLKIYRLEKKDIEILIEEKASADYFEMAASELKSFNPQTNYQLLCNYFNSDLRGLMKEKGLDFKSLKIKPEHLAHLVYLAEKENFSSRLIKDLLAEMLEKGEDPETLIKEKKISFISDENQLLEVIKKIIEENKKAVEDYKKGKENALQFLIGQAMKKTKSQASPEKIKEIFLKQLSSISH